MLRRSSLFIVVCLSIAGLLGLSSSSWALHAWNARGSEEETVSVRASCGMLEGEAHEYVYDDTFFGFGGTYKASELIWDLSGLAVAGAIVSVRPTESWSVQLGGWTCVNKGNGGMVDYDWAMEGIDWTDRSISDVEVVSSYMADINVAYRFFKRESLSLSGVIGYKQDFWKWEDSFIELLYSVDGFRDYYEEGDGSNMIDYEQLFQIPYIGINSACVWGRFALTAYLLYSPLVMAEDKDYHIQRDIRFEETFSGGNYFGGGLAAQYDVTSAFFLSASLDCQSIPEFKGDMELTDELGDTYSYSDSAGISHLSSMLSASVGVRF
jgi:outer membrane protease